MVATAPPGSVTLSLDTSNVPLTLLTDKVVVLSLYDATVAVAPDDDPVIMSPTLYTLGYILDISDKTIIIFFDYL
tara:strand:+ start:1813 stop:2037 length:225 start_codon:yes stop_codon:yes gene_type:complete